MKIYSNRKYVKHLMILILLIAFSSCEDFFETTLELELPEYEEQVVISAVLDNLDKRELLLTKTVGINDDEYDSNIDEATIKLFSTNGIVYLFENEIINTNFSSAPNYHLKDAVDFIPGETYNIEVTTKEGKVATAKSKMPPTPKLISAKYRASGGTTIDGDKLDAIDVVFQDTPDFENFYRIKLSYKEGGLNSLYLESNDPSAEESADFISLILRDTQFDGEEYRIQILFRAYSNNEFEVEDLVLEFKSITEDQYKFDKILNNFYDNEDNPFNSATQLYTNVENGIGLFALENSVESDIEE